MILNRLKFMMFPTYKVVDFKRMNQTTDQWIPRDAIFANGQRDGQLGGGGDQFALLQEALCDINFAREQRDRQLGGGGDRFAIP